MTLHKLLPLVALLLNVSLAGVAVLRNPGSRLNRVFAYFASGMALWNMGVFLLRQAPDANVAHAWEVVIHVGVISLPVFYYHFVLIFLESTARHRASLVAAYALGIGFTVVNMSGSALFLGPGAVWTRWGWAPKIGPLYVPFLLYLNAFLVWGLCHLVAAHRRAESSFRRNRTRLIVFGTAVSLIGGFVDFTRFIVARFFPQADHVYPPGIPANMIFALMLGISIVRYRLFDVNVAVKRTATYLVLGVGTTCVLALVSQMVERYFDLDPANAIWASVPLGVAVTLLLSPLGQHLADQAQRLTFSRRRGSSPALLDLSKRISTILDFRRLVDTLVEGVTRDVPLTQCVLLIHDPDTGTFIPYRTATTIGESFEVAPVAASRELLQLLRHGPAALVKEEAKLDLRIADELEALEPELEALPAALILPLRIEDRLVGILLLGEKLSGEIFDGTEIEVLSVLASQAAVALQNAQLYAEIGASNARLKQVSRLKSQFLANMSHELRTPLNSIIGFSKVLLNRMHGDLTEHQETYIRSVHHSSVHLLQLINDILDFSRIEAGKIDMRPEEVDLHELVDECIETSLALVRSKPLKLEKEIAVGVPWVTADRTKVKQVLLNLLSNAIKFTAAGRVVVRVHSEADGVHITVSDTGMGIKETELPRLFEPFERLVTNAQKDAGGTGLGLAISKKFVELHGGRIWAESRENRGSSFHFTLPATSRALETSTP